MWSVGMEQRRGRSGGRERTGAGESAGGGALSGRARGEGVGAPAFCERVEDVVSFVGNRNE